MATQLEQMLNQIKSSLPTECARVLDELTRTGMLDACGSDFYMLTERGKGTIVES